MNRREGKKKVIRKKKKKAVSPKPTVLSPTLSKEIIGLAHIGVSLIVLVGIFSTNSGLFGKLLKDIVIGLLGIGGYIVPIGTMFIGIFYMRGEAEKVYRTLIYGGVFVLMLITFFHLLYYGEASEISLWSFGYFENSGYQNGGYAGALVGQTLLSLFGIYGAYILLAISYSIWMLLLTQFPIFTWLGEKISLLVKEVKRVGCAQSRPKKQPKKQITPLAIQKDTMDDTSANEIVFYDSREVTLDTQEQTKEVLKEASKEEPPIQPELASDETIKEELNMGRVMQDEERPYQFPPINLLKKVTLHQDKEASKKSISNARKLEETLASFGVEAKVTQIHRGPSVTRYELQPKQGVKVSKIVNLADDIALNLAASNIRIEAPIPGKAAVGIEVANSQSEIVYLREVIESDRFLAFPSQLAFALGKDIAGKPVITDIAKMPHLLIAGATGSGKSVCINTLITSIIYKSNPQQVKLIMIDPKVVELSVYNGIPHLMIPVVTDPKKAAGALFWAVNEMTKRYNLFAENSVRDMKGYNEKQILPENHLPQIVIIIDELADLMMTGAKEVEDAICRLAQMARAAGIHLVIATQRPSVDVITGVIKANIPSRLAFAVSSGTDSRTILDMTGAEKLLGKGDMLFYPVGESKPIRIQGAFISDKEVEEIVNAIKTDQSEYEQSVIESLENTPSMEGEAGEEVDELLEKAIELSKDKDKLSISMLQRYFRIGFNRASRLMDSLEARGIVGPDEGSKPRKVL